MDSSARSAVRNNSTHDQRGQERKENGKHSEASHGAVKVVVEV